MSKQQVNYAQVGKRVSFVRRNGVRAVGTVSAIWDGRRGSYVTVQSKHVPGGYINVRPSQLQSPKAD